jgi:tRNA(Leu) C34 or U34 (ribose-2'-O)-methylase TrmL
MPARTATDRSCARHEFDAMGVTVELLSTGTGAAESTVKVLVTQMDELVVIPHSSRVESLNAGVAASIVLYEAARKRG